MQVETQAPVTQAARNFAVPVGLLRVFKNDIRRIPEIPHANGWIIFDKEMLVSVLRNNDIKERTELARQIEMMGKAGGELMIVQP